MVHLPAMPRHATTVALAAALTLTGCWCGDINVDPPDLPGLDATTDGQGHSGPVLDSTGISASGATLDPDSTGGSTSSGSGLDTTGTEGTSTGVVDGTSTGASESGSDGSTSHAGTSTSGESSTGASGPCEWTNQVCYCDGVETPISQAECVGSEPYPECTMVLGTACDLACPVPCVDGLECRRVLRLANRCDHLAGRTGRPVGGRARATCPSVGRDGPERAAHGLAMHNEHGATTTTRATAKIDACVGVAATSAVGTDRSSV